MEDLHEKNSPTMGLVLGNNKQPGPKQDDVNRELLK